MARKSALSHTAAAFGAMIAGKLCVEYVKKYFPDLFKTLDSAAASLIDMAQSVLPFAVDTQLAAAVLVGLTLAFVWGWLYHYVRHD